MYKAFGLLLLIATPWVARAQYEQFLKDPHITWAAEIEITYSLKPPPAVDPLRENDIYYWKSYDPKAQIQYDGAEMLIRKMLDAARSGAWPAWQLQDMSRQIPVADVSGSPPDWHDTIVTFDVVTFEERIKIVSWEPDPEGYTAIRARQLLFFDNKKGEFGLATIAVAPVFTITRKVKRQKPWQFEGDSIVYEFAPFWLKMPAVSKKALRKHPKVNDSKVVWAAQIKTLGNSPEPDHVPALKNTGPPAMQVLLDRFRYDPRYKATDFYDEPVAFASRNGLFLSTDTTVSYEPETWKENLKVVRKELQAADTPHLRLVENWYWDERRQRLIIRLERFAPLVERENATRGYTYYSRPLFYRRKK